MGSAENDAIRAALNAEPANVENARAYHKIIRERLGEQVIEKDGKVVTRRVFVDAPDGQRRTAIFMGHVADVLVDQVTDTDSRFETIPTDLLQGLARVAFELGIEAMTNNPEEQNG